MRLWTQQSNYIGEDFSDYYVGLSRTRDSHVFEESNFDSLLELLGGESSTVIVARFSNWLCGWHETIFVRKDDLDKVAILSQAEKDLEDYPLLDEDDAMERESEAIFEDAYYHKDTIVSEIVEKVGLPESCKEDKDFLNLIVALYREDACYCGMENAWVTLETIERELDNIEYAYKNNVYWQYFNSVLGK